MHNILVDSDYTDNVGDIETIKDITKDEIAILIVGNAKIGFSTNPLIYTSHPNIIINRQFRRRRFFRRMDFLVL